jgi:hypothetical protein
VIAIRGALPRFRLRKAYGAISCEADSVGNPASRLPLDEADGVLGSDSAVDCSVVPGADGVPVRSRPARPSARSLGDWRSRELRRRGGV